MAKHDVVILGGGLAGLTLALQLRQARPNLSVLVLEKRSRQAPVAAHKVGESIVELGSFYLREILRLKDYLSEEQLPKLGFRFFFSPEQGPNIARRVEAGSRISHPIPAHHIDRGLFENELTNRLKDLGVDIIPGAAVQNVELSRTGHEIYFEKEGVEHCKKSSWIVDSTGRGGLLKRKLGLEKKCDHHINAAWFRIQGEIDIDHWSDDPAWRAYLEPGRRRLATNHLMGEGYWVWIIPLASGHTSIGIVADPSFHPFNQFNSLEKAMKWLERNEAGAAAMLREHGEKAVDFKVLKHPAHDIRQFYSADRWGVTGDAGAFLDPFYSPGTDFIALGNSWLADLIVRDTGGENIALRTKVYEHAHRELFNGWIMLYKNMYGLFGKTRLMLLKIVWDWATYWAVPCLMFMNKGYTDLAVLKHFAAPDGAGRRFSKLNERMQALFLAWSKCEIEPLSDRRVNVFDLACLHDFHLGIARKYAPQDLISQVEANLTILEHLSAEIFRQVSAQVHGTPLDMKVDPYEMTLNDSKEELLEKSKDPRALGLHESIRADLEMVWQRPVKTTSGEYA